MATVWIIGRRTPSSARSGQFQGPCSLMPVSKKILKSTENKTLAQRIHSFSGDNLATNSHLLQITHVPNKTNISKSTGSTPRMRKQRKWGAALQGYTNRGYPNNGPHVTHQLVFLLPVATSVNYVCTTKKYTTL